MTTNTVSYGSDVITFTSFDPNPGQAFPDALGTFSPLPVSARKGRGKVTDGG